MGKILMCFSLFHIRMSEKEVKKTPRRIFKFASNVSKEESRKTKDLSSVCDKFIILNILTYLCKGRERLLIVFFKKSKK